MDIKPLNRNVVIDPMPEEEISESGIAIAKTEGERSESIALKGKVLAVTDAVKIVKKGDVVLVGKWEAQIAFIKSKKVLIIKEDHILAKL